jgi:hypothetical protein
LYTERYYAVDAHSVVSIIFSINLCNRRAAKPFASPKVGDSTT